MAGSKRSRQATWLLGLSASWVRTRGSLGLPVSPCSPDQGQTHRGGRAGDPASSERLRLRGAGSHQPHPALPAASPRLPEARGPEPLASSAPFCYISELERLYYKRQGSYLIWAAGPVSVWTHQRRRAGWTQACVRRVLRVCGRSRSIGQDLPAASF